MEEYKVPQQKRQQFNVEQEIGKVNSIRSSLGEEPVSMNTGQQKGNDLPENFANFPPQLQQAFLAKKNAGGNQKQDESSFTSREDIENYKQASSFTEVKQPTLNKITNQLDELLSVVKQKTLRFEQILLPSLGRFYTDEDGISEGILHVRPMTGEEEEILTTVRHVKKGQAINMIFKNCIKEPIRPERLLTADRTYLLIYLRGISYGANYEIEIKCPSCGAKFTNSVDLDSDVSVTYCPDNFDQNNLFDKLPTTEFLFRYRLPNGKDDQMVLDYREKRVKGTNSEELDDTFSYRAALLIEEIRKQDGTLTVNDKKVIHALIGKLPINDVVYIRNLLNEPPFGVNTDVPIICPSCSEEFTIDLPMESNFFFPRKKKMS